MSKPPKLTIELVPKTCWFSNVRSEVSASDWKKIQTKVFSESWQLCEICNGSGSKWPVECHEVWHYDDTNLIQKLVKMIALCPSCHEVKHIGLAEVRGRLKQAVKHLMKVNGWTKKEANDYIAAQFEVWNKRSTKQWTLDISILNGYCVTIKERKTDGNGK